jgi:flavin reductase (DIM6/NTAB) family NADH-FMN oxidoreductase RutF/rubredoxin
MISFEALFKISYGLFIVSSGDKNKGNGFISNTVFQVTSDPAKFAVCCNKNNYTAEFIRSFEVFSVSVLHQNAAPEIFGRFGYKSGRDIDKLDGMSVIYGETGVPIVMNDCIAFLECDVRQTIDVGTHLIFIGKLIRSEVVDDTKEPITYNYYRQVKKGVAPKNAPTYIDLTKLKLNEPEVSNKRFQCAACGYIYDEATECVKFSELPETWICPSCGSDKSDFFEVQPIKSYNYD